MSARALDILHADAVGVDQQDACQASCYECLRSFYNQWHHDALDRTLVVGFFVDPIRGTTVAIDQPGEPWDEVVTSFDSATEEATVAALRAAGLPAPTSAHQGLPADHPVASADLYYVGEGIHIAVFLDGAVHDNPVQQKIDAVHREKLRDCGYSVVVIRHDELEAGIANLKSRLNV